MLNVKNVLSQVVVVRKSQEKYFFIREAEALVWSLVYFFRLLYRPPQTSRRGRCVCSKRNHLILALVYDLNHRRKPARRPPNRTRTPSSSRYGRLRKKSVKTMWADFFMIDLLLSSKLWSFCSSLVYRRFDLDFELPPPRFLFLQLKNTIPQTMLAMRTDKNIPT